MKASANSHAIISSADHHLRLDAKLRRELGGTVMSALEDPETEDIVLNPDSRIWVKKQGSGFASIGRMSPAQVLAAIGTIAAQRATVVNYDRPILEAELPVDGSRFEGVVPPVVRQPTFAIRQRPRQVFTLEDYEASAIISERSDSLNGLKRRGNFAESVRGMVHGEILRAAIGERKNILIVGSTGSGKTTLVNALLETIARMSPADRVISIEDTMELQCRVDNYVDLRAVAGAAMRDCLRACMRLHPTRIVVGEVRGAEAHVMLKSWNTGHPGGLATIHANDAMSGLVRLEGPVAEATAAPQQALIAEAVDLVVFIDQERSLAAGRKLREMLVVTGHDRGQYLVEYV